MIKSLANKVSEATPIDRVSPADERVEEHILQTYFSLRTWLAYLAIAFPWLLFFLTDELRGSLSAYYNSETGVLFSGILFALAACMFFYRGYTNGENWILNVAAILTVCIAIFPHDAITNMDARIIFRFDLTDCAGEIWGIPYSCVGAIHQASAILAFVCIGIVAIFFAKNSLENIKEPEVVERYTQLYRRSGISMVVIPFVIAGLVYLLDRKWVIFAAETAGLFVFALYWLVKTWEMHHATGTQWNPIPRGESVE